MSETFSPVADGTQDGCYITSSLDATSHFESASEEILQMYEKIVGEKLDLNIEPDDEEEY